MSRYTLPLALALFSGLAVAAMTSPPAPTGIEPAPGDTVRLRPSEAARTRVRDLEAWLAQNPTTRGHVALDRPLYRPGETVQARLWSVSTRGLSPTEGGAQVELHDPRGQLVESRGVALEHGGASLSFALPADAPGGEWTLKVSGAGPTLERSFDVEHYEAPRVKKSLTFARDGYAPGDTVEAALALTRATGEPFAGKAVVATPRVAGQALAPISAMSDSRGEVTLRFALPKNLASPDVTLAVTVDDGGWTESISESVPVALSSVNLHLYPEGGDLVTGLQSRVYFEATDNHGEPVDVTGEVVDDRGTVVGAVASVADGRGAFALTPVEGRSYRVRLASGQEAAVPAAREEGCVMHHFDDLDGAQTAVRVRVACTSPQDVTVLAAQSERVLDRATFHVEHENTVHLRTADPALANAPGVARVTVFDAAQAPMAERLVFRNKSKGLRVSVRPDRKQYEPGDSVTLTVATHDAFGRPVPADLSLAVVDDTVLAHADDDAQSLASALLLQADLPDPIEGAADWFRADATEGGRAVDLALGTRGWRRFDWTATEGAWQQQQDQLRWQREARWAALRPAPDLPMLAAMPMGGAGMGMEDALMVRDEPVAAVAEEKMVFGAGAAAKEDQRRTLAKPTSAPQAAPVNVTADVREYAAPIRAKVRSDFRDTVHWVPALHTGSDGVATVTFTLSDAVTGFRATAEGLGGGLVGVGDALISSTLPFHVETRLPAALSTGDHLELPITLENQREGALSVSLAARVGELLHLGEVPGAASLRAGERTTLWVPLDARPGNGTAEVAIDATAGSTADALVRSVPVVPRGVPREWSVSGRLDRPAQHTVTIPAEALEGSVSGSVTLLPTPISEVLAGIENMVRTPGGCFEQTSSTNWPNVVVIDLLQRSGGLGKLGVDRSQVLATGHQILRGYQVGTGGFETWGSGPGKEALTAYGLLEFTDMARVYDVDRRLLTDSAEYLMGQRNGLGGYSVTGSSAHGYGTAPPEVLDAYITYALVETGHTGLDREIDKSAALARKSADPYRMGLATLTLLRARPAEGRAAAARLASLQAADGGFPGSETSITRSENYNLDVEATALGAMALLRAGNVVGAQRAVSWLHAHQTGAGQWGATQGNALALRAIGELATAAPPSDQVSTLVVSVDGERVVRTEIPAGSRDPLTVDLGRFLNVGRHDVSITLDGGAVPYVLEAGWTTERPQSDADRRVDLETRLEASSLTLGQSTRMIATVSNRTAEVVPDPIARIGLPAGLSPRREQLEELKARGEIAFFELRPREVTLYWDGVAAREAHSVALELTATSVGRFTAPASAAYPYYDDQARAWQAGAEVVVAR